MRAKRRWLFLLSLFPLLLLSVCLLSPEARAHAGGLVQEAVGATSRLYDRYPLKNYNLDFWVDDGFSLNIGKEVSEGFSYMLYLVTLSVWDFVRMIGYFVGQLVEEAYEMDFISSTIGQVSQSMQRLAGISAGGLSSKGLFPAFLPLLILIVGIYVAYLAVVKRQASKGLRSALAFVLVAVLGMGMIAGSGRYLGMLNDFQKELNQEILAVTGTITQGTEGGGTEGIRDSLFSILVYEPYLLLQYGTTDTEEIGQERIDALLSAPFGSEEREQIAEEEVTDLENENMSASNAAGRLGTAFLILLLDLVIIICVALFCAVMIFSQILFSLYAMFLPVALVFSLFPNSMGNLMGALKKIFGCMMRKAGVTVILSVVFSLSSMAYSLAGSKGFLWVAFLQIVIYVGAFMKCSELLGFMRIGTDGEERAARKMRGRASALLHTVMLGKILRRGRGGSGRQRQEDPTPGNREAPNRKKQEAAPSSSPAPSGRRAAHGGTSPDSQPLSDGRDAGLKDGSGASGKKGAEEEPPVRAASPYRRTGRRERTEGMDPSGVPGRPPSSPSPVQGGQEKEGDPSGRKREKRQYAGQYEGSHGRHGSEPKASPGASPSAPSDRWERDRDADRDRGMGRLGSGEDRRKKDYADAEPPVQDRSMRGSEGGSSASHAPKEKSAPRQKPPAGRMAKEIGEPGQRPLEERASKEQGEAEPKAPAAPASADRKKDFHERHSDIYSKSVKENAPDSPGRDPARSRDVGYKKGGVGFASKPTKFSNFEEREYDMDVLEDLLLEASRREAKGWPDGSRH